MTLFVGNFPYETTSEELMTVFAVFGQVESVKLIRDRFSGCPRGFGFITMERTCAMAAMGALHRSSFGGRPLNVREAGPVRREVTVAGKPDSSSSDPQSKGERFAAEYWLQNRDQLPSSERRAGGLR
jgi:RNA recognition motif-containing protein